MCCEAFCRGLCSILSSSAILVLDIVDAAVGAALLFSPLLWSSCVRTAATRRAGHDRPPELRRVPRDPERSRLAAYGLCGNQPVSRRSVGCEISLFGVGFRSNSGLLAAAVLAALCFVTEFTGGLIIASDPDFAAKLGLEIPIGLGAPRGRGLVAPRGPRGLERRARPRARRLRRVARAKASRRAGGAVAAERAAPRTARRSRRHAELTAKYFSEESPKPEPRKWWSLRKSEPEEEAAAELPSFILRSKNYAAPRSFDDDEENGFAI